MLKTIYCKDDPFISWVMSNIETLQQGVGEYNGIPITGDTKVYNYLMVISYIKICYLYRSRFIVSGIEKDLRTAVHYTAVTMLVGWWSFEGLFLSVYAIMHNILGGRKFKVRQLIAELTGHLRNTITLTERAAANIRQEIKERGFPENTAIYLNAIKKFHPDYQIRYDVPVIDGTKWRAISQGMTIFFDKKNTAEVDGIVIDFEANALIINR